MSSWEERFDKEFGRGSYWSFEADGADGTDGIKDFISKEITRTREETRKEIADSIPSLFLMWRGVVELVYKQKKDSVLLDFPTWLAEYLDEKPK